MAIANRGSGDLLNNGGIGALTAAYTVNAASDLLIVYFLGDVIGGADDISSVTDNGVAMTLAAKNTTGGNNRIQYAYQLSNPATGSHNIVITPGSNHYVIAVAADYSGTNTSSPIGNTGFNISSGASDTSLTSSLSVGTANSWVLVLEQSYQGGSPPTAGTGDVRRINGGALGEPTLFDSNAALSTGSNSFTTNSASNAGFYIYHLLVEIKVAGAAPSGNLFRTPLLNGLGSGGPFFSNPLGRHRQPGNPQPWAKVNGIYRKAA